VLGLDPGFQAQARYTSEVVLIVGHQDHFVGAHSRSDEEIEVLDKRSGAAQLGFDLPKSLSRLHVNGYNRQRSHEIVDCGMVALRSIGAFGSIAGFRQSYDRDRYGFWANGS